MPKVCRSVYLGAALALVAACALRALHTAFVVPAYAELWHAMAFSFAREGKLEDARAIVSELVERSPRNSDFLVSWGTLEMQAGRHAAAAAALQRAIDVDPSLTSPEQGALAYTNLGHALLRLDDGRAAEATAAFERAAALAPPDDPRPRCSLCLARAQRMIETDGDAGAWREDAWPPGCAEACGQL
jgi:tetratricopeptide (TPR) repeat protein